MGTETATQELGMITHTHTHTHTQTHTHASHFASEVTLKKHLHQTDAVVVESVPWSPEPGHKNFSKHAFSRIRALKR